MPENFMPKPEENKNKEKGKKTLKDLKAFLDKDMPLPEQPLTEQEIKMGLGQNMTKSQPEEKESPKPKGFFQKRAHGHEGTYASRSSKDND